MKRELIDKLREISTTDITVYNALKYYDIYGESAEDVLASAVIALAEKYDTLFKIHLAKIKTCTCRRYIIK